MQQSIPRPAWIDNQRTVPLCDVPWVGTSVVLSDGGVNFCCFSSAIVGNVNENSFEDIWNGKDMQRIRHELAAHRMPVECQSTSCPIFRRDEVHFIYERIEQNTAVDPATIQEFRDSLSDSRLSCGRNQFSVGDRVELEIDLSWRSHPAWIDVFVGVKRPDQPYMFMPDFDDFAIPFSKGFEIRESGPAMKLPALALDLPGTYEICAAIYQHDGNPNMPGSCCWSETISLVVGPAASAAQ